MKPIIIAIVGASGSGKTYLTKYLRNELNIPVIVSTTTRPRRPDEIEGEDYFFIKNTKGYSRKEMLTYTKFGKFEYFSLLSQLPESGFCTYVVDENGIESLKSIASPEFSVVSVLVQCRTELLERRGIDSERIERDLSRKQINYDLIDLILHNNGSVEEFEKGACDMMKILEQWQPLL